MAEQSSMHSYLNWAKQRIDEMDATLASLEAKAGQVQADSKVKANQLVADLKKQRDEFQANVNKQAKATEAAWESNKAQLDSQWKAFEAQVRTYIWPAPGSADTELGVLMEPEVSHGETEVYTRVQA